MLKSHNHPALQQFYRSSIELAREGLRKSCQLPAGDDPALIRAALQLLPRNGKITRIRDLVNLRWATILLEQLPHDHPEHRELNLAWYQAKDRVKEAI